MLQLQVSHALVEFDVLILWVFWKLDTHHVWVNFLAEIFMEVSLLEAILAGVKLTATLLQEQPLLEIILVLVMMFVTLSGSMLEVLPLATRPVFEIFLVMQSMDTGFVISTVDIFLWMSSPALETRPAFKFNKMLINLYWKELLQSSICMHPDQLHL